MFGKEKGIKLKLLPKEGEGCYLSPVSESDSVSEKYLKLKRLIGSEYFRDNLQGPNPEDIKIEEIGEEGELEFDDEEEVDIDIDPHNINEEQAEVIKSLYLEQKYDELEDDFMLKANLDEVLEEYKDDIPEVIHKVPQQEFDDALNEFIEETKIKEEKNFTMDFERIPFEKDLVLQAAIVREPSPDRDPVFSQSSDESDDVVSHTSHYTNTDNRPAVIQVREKKVKKEKAEVKNEKINEDNEKNQESGKRIRGETKEEKKARKEKIKADKKTAREKKKVLKEIYKNEKVKLDEKEVGTYDIRQGTSVIKLS